MMTTRRRMVVAVVMIVRSHPCLGYRGQVVMNDITIADFTCMGCDSVSG
jgi:hypothetical protein